MNLVGHVHVARLRGDDDPEAWLGSMLPDLAREAGTRLGPLERWSPGVARGIRCHRATDDAFHASVAFRAGSRRLREDLGAAGLATGPARAVAHAGWELLLDGVLLDEAGTAEAYATALAVPMPRLTTGLPVDEQRRWSAALARRRSAGPPALYADPGAVAALLHRVLASRPRLAFDRGAVPAVAGVLLAHQPAIAAAAGPVIAAARAW